MVVQDPEHCFGRPRIDGTGVATESVYDMFLGEEAGSGSRCRHIAACATWFSITFEQAREAIRYEENAGEERWMKRHPATRP